MTAGARDASGHPPSMLVPLESARGRIRTCTGGALDAVPLLLGYTSEMKRDKGALSLKQYAYRPARAP